MEISSTLARQPGLERRAENVFEQACDFVTQFRVERPDDCGDPAERLREIRDEIDATGTYTHTYPELAFGAQVAWRNAERCLGRLYWQSLVVRDARDAGTAERVAEECFTHLREAHNGGRIRPMITIFPPDRPGNPGPRILNSQLIRYAGFRQNDGRIVGDPMGTGATDLALRLGWPGQVGRFEPLPLIVSTQPGVEPHWFSHPPGTIVEVPITHPDYPWFADLGLRWYTVPAISALSLEIGGVLYPSAPQSGWYVVTEIGTRDFGDTERYDQLPAVADGMGLDRSRDDTLWKDRAAVELTVAVMHSFRTAGVTMGDHHTEAARFLMHVDRERRAGRTCPTKWSWIVPPLSGSTTPVFHRYYDPEEPDRRPAFVPRRPWPLD